MQRFSPCSGSTILNDASRDLESPFDVEHFLDPTRVINLSLLFFVNAHDRCYYIVT